jgi:hypothetical protein
MDVTQNPSATVRVLVHAVIEALLEHPEFRAATVQDGINIAASLLVTFTFHVERSLDEARRLTFRAVMAEELHKLADQVLAGVYHLHGDTPERVH